MQILIALVALWLPILAGYQMGRLENAQIEPGGWVETCELQRFDGEVVEVCTPDYYQVRAFALVTLPPLRNIPPGTAPISPSPHWKRRPWAGGGTLVQGVNLW